MSFEKATRLKLRFVHCGQISVEDLWDLDVERLDTIYSGLRAGQKAADDESLLRKTKTREDELRDLKIDLVKHVVKTKLEEDETRKSHARTKMQKERIAEIIQSKQDEGLKNMTLEDLQKEMEKLDA